MKKFHLAIGMMCGAILFTGCQTTQPLENNKLTTTVNLVDSQGIGKNIGSITFSDSNAGLVIQTHLKDLPSGAHGFHIHENPACGAALNPQGVLTAAQQAGGHFDPNKAGAHGSPTGNGHLGDLTTLIVSDQQTADQTLIAPRLTTALIKGRSIMIHAGADNYSDTPQPLGGGGARIACGVIAK